MCVYSSRRGIGWVFFTIRISDVTFSLLILLLSILVTHSHPPASALPNDTTCSLFRAVLVNSPRNCDQTEAHASAEAMLLSKWQSPTSEAIRSKCCDRRVIGGYLGRLHLWAVGSMNSLIECASPWTSQQGGMHSAHSWRILDGRCQERKLHPIVKPTNEHFPPPCRYQGQLPALSNRDLPTAMTIRVDSPKRCMLHGDRPCQITAHGMACRNTDRHNHSSSK